MSLLDDMRRNAARLQEVIDRNMRMKHDAEARACNAEDLLEEIYDKFPELLEDE